MYHRLFCTVVSELYRFPLSGIRVFLLLLFRAALICALHL